FGYFCVGASSPNQVLVAALIDAGGAHVAWTTVDADFLHATAAARSLADALLAGPGPTLADYPGRPQAFAELDFERRLLGAVPGESASGFERVSGAFARAGELSDPVQAASALAAGGVSARFPGRASEPIRFAGPGLALELREEGTSGDGEPVAKAIVYPRA